MTSKNIYRSLGGLDPELVMKAAPDNKVRKKNNIWVKWTALAACFALIIGTLIVLPMFREDDAPQVTDPLYQDDFIYTPITFDATVQSEKLSGSNLEYIVDGSVSSGISSINPKVELRLNEFIVKAKVVENYSDLYYELDVDPNYNPLPFRLIKMECIDVIHGDTVPQYFYYLIRDRKFVDMSVYDCLIVAMAQFGTENFIIKNQTKNQLDVLELPVFIDYQRQPELGNIIAFSNGIFDESLWQTESWREGYQFAEMKLDNPETNDLVVDRGDTIDDAVEEIKSRIVELSEYGWYKFPKLLTYDYPNEEIQKVFEYVKPFKNGVFSQSYDGYSLVFIRFINGCQTDERIIITIYNEEIIYSDVSYTQEDMLNIENISVQLSNLSAKYSQNMPTPPHTDPTGKKLLSFYLYAWYAKVDGKIYGVIKSSWIYQKNGDWHTQYYDEEYILFDISAATAEKISREDLISIVGSRNISKKEFGEVTTMPMC